MIVEVKEKVKNWDIAILFYGNPALYTKQEFEKVENYTTRNNKDMFMDALHVCGLHEGLWIKFQEDILKIVFTN